MPIIYRSRSEMDITTGFEPVIGGSSPSESTKGGRWGEKAGARRRRGGVAQNFSKNLWMTHQNNPLSCCAGRDIGHNSRRARLGRDSRSFASAQSAFRFSLHFLGKIALCAGRENRTPASSLARTCATTKPYPHRKN